MAYENPVYLSYSFQFDFGGGAADTFEIHGPLGKRGRVYDIHCSALEVFTTGGKIEVGSAADPNEFAELSLGTLAEGDALNAQNDGSIYAVNIDADEDVHVDLTQTGGTPTGIGIVTVTIGWF